MFRFTQLLQQNHKRKRTSESIFCKNTTIWALALGLFRGANNEEELLSSSTRLIIDLRSAGGAVAGSASTDSQS